MSQLRQANVIGFCMQLRNSEDRKLGIREREERYVKLCFSSVHTVTQTYTKVTPSLSLSLSLANVVIYPHCFLTAYKSLWRLPDLAGTSDSKNPGLYFCFALFTIPCTKQKFCTWSNVQPGNVWIKLLPGLRFWIHRWTTCRPCCWLWSTWLWWRTERSSLHAALWPQGCAPGLSAKQQLLNCLWRQLQSDQGEVQIHPVPGNSQVWKLKIKIQWGLKIRIWKTRHHSKFEHFETRILIVKWVNEWMIGLFLLSTHTFIMRTACWQI